MELGAFERLIVAELSRAGFPYVVTGSYATIHYGEPRSTNDMDIIIDPTQPQLIEFVKGLQHAAMAELEPALEAFRRRTMFNVISYETVEKIDFIFLKATGFEQSLFERRRVEVVIGTPLFLVTPEDAIISKLRWARASLSELQLRDVVGTMLVQWDELDWDYLEGWVKQLSLENIYTTAKSESEKRRVL